MSNPGPAIEGTVNPFTATGGVNGTKVANSVTETVGFYGATGVAKQTGVAVSAAAIHAALVAVGLISA